MLSTQTKYNRLVNCETDCLLQNGSAANRIKRLCIALFSLVFVLFVSACYGNALESTSQVNLDVNQIMTKDVKQLAFKRVANKAAEPLANVQYNGVEVIAEVISHGCTAAEDFSVQHESVDNVCYATVVRDKPDYCRRAPAQIKIVLKWSQPEACASLPLAFTNPELSTGAEKVIKKRFLDQSADPSSETVKPENRDQ